MCDTPIYCLMNYSRAEAIFQDDYCHVRSDDLDCDMMLLLSWWSGSTAICMSSLFTNCETVAACLGSSFSDGDLAVDSSPESSLPVSYGSHVAVCVVRLISCGC